MAKLLLSPSEGDLAELFGDDAISSSIPEQKGADILAYTRQGLLGIQRKSIPHDFIASVTDGRLARETSLLRDSCVIRLLLNEGRFRYWPDGHLSVDRKVPSRFTRRQIRGILYDIKYVKGVDYDYSEDLEDTVRYVRELISFLNKEKHLGMYTRPSDKGTWYVPSARDVQLWLLQGFPGIGPATADKIISRFGKIPLEWTCTLNELMEVPGLSKKKAQEIYIMLSAYREKKVEVGDVYQNLRSILKRER